MTDPTPTTSAERRETAIERADREHPAELASARATVRVHVALNEWRTEDRADNGDVWCPPEEQDRLVDRVTEAARQDASAERVAALEGVAEAARWAVEQAERDGVPVNRLAALVPARIVELLSARLATLDEHA